MELELRLVDVNSDSVSETWPLLLDSVEKAHFIALDLVTNKLCSASRTYLIMIFLSRS